uniref:Uncharacterized protein n=1 Tax=Vespula pensylvanica TaxID=30213 RepID=A0A834P971_VESPE|nr:hypothetical protein H0235_002067 [Vespula pensylvanica]
MCRENALGQRGQREEEKGRRKENRSKEAALPPSLPTSPSLFLSAEIKLLRCCLGRSRAKEKIVKVMAVAVEIIVEIIAIVAAVVIPISELSSSQNSQHAIGSVLFFSMAAKRSARDA